jgi:hypothetical protein
MRGLTRTFWSNLTPCSSGQWRAGAGLLDGSGRYTYPDGSYYRGSWADGRRE